MKHNLVKMLPVLTLFLFSGTGIFAAEQKLPVVLSRAEVQQILSRLYRLPYRVCLTTIYACGLRLREGVHHVLHTLMNRGKLTGVEAEVFRALEGSAPSVQAAWAANKALIAERDL